ncbi:hypothetical protein LTR36_006577 [Oleoguttula mirabilis]|uniref:Uncharacterized protein n=1 Tax=Oleoguttula mirabilis TaxID=1507867 RepID=A0AAV9JVQ5_9PEZI|nr:hypothetical protein LTR36_006577 [Oleoguttula mirabilis]
MKDIGLTRKKKGNYGQVNRRQLPVYDSSEDQATANGRNARATLLIRSSVICSSGATSGGSSSSTTARSSSSPETSPPINGDGELVEFLPTVNHAGGLLDGSEAEQALSYELMFSRLTTAPDYERARSKFGVGLTDLAVLTNFNVGKNTIAILSADSSRLASLLGQQHWSYLEYVPSRYGTSDCLTAATNVLLAKVQTVLAPKDECAEICNRLYGKALRALQHAISDESLAMEADVLCATQLLSLHELLDPSRDTAWAHHVHGSARLVKHRSASRFETDFEKALFAAHVGAIISEALVNNTECYLDQPEWTELYASMTQESHFLTDRSALSIQVRLAFFILPGLWHDVGECVNSAEYFSCGPLTLLESRCRKAHRKLLDWLEDYKAHCVRLSFAQLPPSELALRRELFGSALECLAIVKRLLATVCDTERRSLEVETQALAHLVLDLQKQPAPKHSWLFSGHEVGVAYTMLLTKSQWEENVSRGESDSHKMASRTRYNTWSNTLRMTG